MSNYMSRVQTALDKLGRVNGTKLPQVNDPDTEWAMKFALGKCIEKHGKRIADAAREKLDHLVSPITKGQVVVHNTGDVVLSVTAITKSGQISADLLKSNIIRAFKCDMATAEAVVDASRGIPVTQRNVSSVLNVE